jgi:hypothetical protein
MLFWDVTQVDWKFITYILGQPINPIIKGQAPSPLKMEPTDCPETSVTNYQSALRNIPEEHRSQTWSFFRN